MVTACIVASATVGAVLAPTGAAASDPDTGRIAPANRGKVTAVRQVADGQRLTFYFGLRRRDAAAQTALLGISNPRASGYLQQYSKRSVIDGFGASRQTVISVRRLLKQRGLTGQLDRSGVFMRVRGTAKRFEQAFNMSLTSTVYTGYTIVSPATTPVVPTALKILAPDRVWQSEFQNNASVPSPPGPTPPPAPMTPLPTNTGTLVGYCPQIAGVLTATMTFQQAMTAYGMRSIKQSAPSGAARGDVRRRSPIGILALGSGYSPTMIEYGRRCFSWAGRILRRSSDGMVRPLKPMGGEGDLDIQMVGAVASKGWTIPVYEGLSSDTDPGQFLPASSAFGDAVTPTVLTNSYGNCEPDLRGPVGAPVRRIADAIYVRLGLIGTTVFVAAGDFGSSVCKLSGQGGGVTVSYPASSPWVTAVGGTQIALTKGNARKSERVWNSWRNSEPNSPSTPVAPVAGTGGYSAIYPKPGWQKALAGRNRRLVPDITAPAAFGPAWPVFTEGNIFPMAGTSASTPFTAAGLSLINARRIARGKRPLGFLNPLIYQLPSNTLFDVTQGTNVLFPVGCCNAAPGYDMASGRGAIKFDRLNAAVSRIP